MENINLTNLFEAQFHGENIFLNIGNFTQRIWVNVGEMSGAIYLHTFWDFHDIVSFWKIITNVIYATLSCLTASKLIYQVDE